MGYKEAIDDARRAARVAFEAGDAVEALDAVEAGQHAHEELGGEARIVAAQPAGGHRLLQVFGKARGGLPGPALVDRAGEGAKARNLCDERAEHGDAFIAEHALAIGDREAQQRAAQGVAALPLAVARRGLELDQHALRHLARDFLEQMVLAGEMAVHGLLRHAGALRDALDARAVAVGEEGGGGGAQHALSIGKGGHEFGLRVRVRTRLDRTV
jgi:hypothetical protein